MDRTEVVWRDDSACDAASRLLGPGEKERVPTHVGASADGGRDAC